MTPAPLTHPRPTTTEAQDDVLAHYELVQAIAYKMVRRLPSWVSVDELISDGVMGLMKALEGFRAEHGLSFESYASIRIRGAILDSLRKHDFVPRSVRRRAGAIDEARAELRRAQDTEPTPAEIAAHLGIEVDEYHDMRRHSQIRRTVSLDAPAFADEGAAPLVERLQGHHVDAEEVVHHRQLLERIPELVGLLPEPEQTVIRRYYLEGALLKEIGLELGVTESRACQLHGKAIKKLRVLMQQSLTLH